MTAQKTAIVRVCTTRLEMTNSLRGGTPMAKALLLMAIKRHDLHPVIPVLSDGHVVTQGCVLRAAPRTHLRSTDSES